MISLLNTSSIRLQVLSRFLKGLVLILTGSVGWLSWYLERKIIMLPDNIFVPGSDDQYPDDKVRCCSNPCTPLVPGKVQVHQRGPCICFYG